MKKQRQAAIREALQATLSAPRDYDQLVQQQADVWTALSSDWQVQHALPKLTPEQRGQVLCAALRTIGYTLQKATQDTRFGNRLPELAIQVVSDAIDFLAEAAPNGRTMVAYRNRHHSFLSTLADLADAACGSPSTNDGFYTEIGKAISFFVLDEDVAGFQNQSLAPETWQQSSIKSAVMEQIVYFVGSASGPIKIGVARDPKGRLETLQTAHYERLSLLAVTKGGLEREQEYHRKFASHRLTGEWFCRHDDILAEIIRLNEISPTLTA